MTRKVIKKRRRVFVACEGQCEQAFIRWIQYLADQSQLHIHLDTHILNGGGYRGMLKTAMGYRAKGIAKGGGYAAAYIALDADRSEGDDWDEAELKKQVTLSKLRIIFQRPNLEGVILRLFNGRENGHLDKTSTNAVLLRVWPEYEKNFSALDLQKKFTQDDLFRMARHDPDLLAFLRYLGFPI